MRRNTTADVWAKVDRRGSDECWPWLGTILADGYAVIKLDGKMPKAHRVVYRLAIGPIPDGLQLDHLCHTDQCKLGKKCPHRRCVNPAHLKPATAKENTLRGSSFAAFNYRKTACHRGHPFDEINTYWTSKGERSCKECRRINDRNTRSHCPQGHAYDEANTLYSSIGQRRCRICVDQHRPRKRRI